MGTSMISLLRALDSIWDSRYELFAQNGACVLIDFHTGEIVEEFPNIVCDGGDPDEDFRNGKTYIVK